jgi:hypothetical protein
MNAMSEKISRLSKEQLQQLIGKVGKKNEANFRIKKLDRVSNTFPQSSAQKRQWFMEQLMSGGVYNVPQAFKITGNLQIGRLEEALNLILRRHESLRTVFKVIGNEPCQVINDWQALKLEVIDLSDLPDEVKEAEAVNLAMHEARAPFDISVGPLWRNKIIKLSENQHLFIIIMHHIISDGWSFGVLIKEIAQWYSILSESKPHLPPLPIQYADYSEWQREQLESEMLQSQLQYWKKQMQNAPTCIHLPLDNHRPKLQTYMGAAKTFTVSGEDLRALQAIAETEKATTFQIILAVLKVLLYRYTLDEDLAIGIPTANRMLKEVENLIGLFINTLVVRTQLSGEMRFNNYLQIVRKTCLEAFEHQTLPFERLVEELQVERRLEHSPVFQVLYAQTEGSMVGIEMPGLTVTPVPIHSGTAQFDLSLYLTVLADGAMGYFEYNTDLFETATIDALVADFHTLIKNIINNPQASIDTLVANINPGRTPLVVVATFTAEPIKNALEYWMEQLLIPVKVEFAPYGQVFQQLLAPGSMVRCNTEGINLIMVRLEDWMQGYDYDSQQSVDRLIQNTREFISSVENAALWGAVSLLICLCPSSDRIAQNKDFQGLIEKMESEIKISLASLPGVEVLNTKNLIWQYEIPEYNDAFADEQGHIPYTQEFFVALGSGIARRIFAKSQELDNCLVIDAHCLKVSEGVNEVWQFAKNRLDAGGLVCLIGNSAAESPTRINIDSVINSIFSSTDWTDARVEEKISNLAKLYQLPLERFVYVTSDEARYREILNNAPRFVVLLLPKEPATVRDYFERLWLFK